MYIWPLSTPLKNIILYGTSIVLMKGVSLIMLPYVATHLPQSELGRLEILTTISVIISIIFGLSLHEALYRFSGTAKKNQQHQITADIFIISIIIGVISLPIIWVICPLLSQLNQLQTSSLELKLLLLPLAFEAVVLVVLSVLRMQEKAWLFFYITTGRTLLQALLTFIVLYYGFGVQAVILAGFISATLQIIVIICLQYQQNKKASINYHIGITVTKKYFSYCLPLMFSGLIIFGLNGLERWFLIFYVSFNEIALYAVAFKFSLILVLLMQPFGLWWMPKRFEYLSNHGIKTTTQITHISLVLLCSLTIFVCYFSPIFIDLFMPKSYHPAKKLIVFLVAIFAVKELNELINMGALIRKETKKILIINIIVTVIGVSLIMILTPIYKINGVLGALIVAQSIRTMTTYWLSQRCFRFPFAVKKITGLFIITTIAIGLSQLQQTLLLHISSAVFSMIILLSFAFWCHLIKFPPHDIQQNTTGDNDVI
ncbi:sugar translocase [Photobacterium aquimaris]|uniref:Lipopolysaccharide biosynthesis protein n=1 Tax=Photobacterium aquimaris TaxID=512643 RepID=A0A2T3ITE1_9GAMM|nr:lipopolysaccharide biosynthesis protein [Photobacterium aquimaris]OBU18373.1 sugar translocase [Photobacterium aquimaris]OBU20796.1 sugar translocase [Photobacterium aquimaris]PSU31615.1 lipopolysaccharide biosynthesis protein [Photobacterium aquimaris]PSW03299.1 lipopolysaccharide biosynthesis protein [Photobacterium aquimaris]